MPDAPRLLFVADAPAAIEALGAVRAGGPVRAQLAPTAEVLRTTFEAPGAVAEWDAVVFVPGGAVEEVELAVFVPDGLPIVVVADEVPLLLTETTAVALPPAALGTLVGRLSEDAADPLPVAADPAPGAETPFAEAAGPVSEGEDAFPEAVAPTPEAAVPNAADPAPEPAAQPPEASPADAPPSDAPAFAPMGALATEPAGALADLPPAVPETPPSPSASAGAPSESVDAPRGAVAAGLDAVEPDAFEADPFEADPFGGDPFGADVFASDGSTAEPDAFADVSAAVADPSDFFGEAVAPALDAADLLAEGPEPPAAPSAHPEAARPAPGRAAGLASAATPSAPAVEAVEMSAGVAALADHLPIGLFRTTPDGRVLYANPALHALLGVPEDLAALDVRTDLGYPREAFEAEIAEKGEVRNLVVSWTRADGRRVHTRENARCLYDAAGRVVAYEGTIEDVTAEVERQREEQALGREHRAVAAFAAAAALSDDPATIHCAAAGALLDATEADWTALLTRTPSGAVAASASAGALPPGLVALVERTPALFGHVFTDRLLAAAAVVEIDAPAPTIEALLALGVGSLSTVPVERAGRRFGAMIWGRSERAAPRPAEGRTAEALAWHVGGHLERVAARGALRDTEATLAVVAEHTPHVLYRLRYTEAGPVTDYLSPAVEALTGYPRAEIEAFGGLRALIDRSEMSEGAALLEGPAEGLTRYAAVYRLATAHGPRWVEDTARLWHDAAGRVLGLVGVVSDVTERRAREEALAERAERALARQRALVDLAGLQGADAYGAAAAAVVAATLEAADASFWTVGTSGACAPLFAPPARRLGGSPAPAVGHVAEHRALAVADVAADPRVAALGLEPFVEAYGLTSLLVAPVRRDGAVAGLVAVHRTDGPHAWDPTEAEFAGAVADAIAMALERDDRDLALAELEEARVAAEGGRAKAEQADRLKSAFLATLSEEVRAPLTSILETADALAAGVPAHHRGAAFRIARSGRELLDTLDTVLELSRLEAGDVVFDPRRTVVAEPVRDAAAPFVSEARNRGLRLDLELDPAVRADLDGAALGRLVSHLVRNAVSFTESGGVHVSVEAEGGEAVVRVADTGRGMNADFLREAFAPFRQEDPATAGVGLGLSLARRLAEGLGGRIEIASEKPGGTVVTVAFPLAAAAAVPDPSPPPSGDGQATPPPSDPGDILGQPFDFTFLTTPVTASAPAPVALPARSSAPPPPAPTDMFDFQFGRPSAADSPSDAASDAAPSAEAASAPAASPDATTAAPPAVEPVLFVRPREGAHRPTIPAAPSPAIEEAEVVSDGRPSVLVVEDNDDTRMLLERILRSTYAVTAVGDARSALLAMNQQRFAGLVLDINLGGKETGADVLRIARSLPNYGGVFAIALTAYALPGDRERLLQSGFNAYISKPFTRASLMETLAEGVSA